MLNQSLTWDNRLRIARTLAEYPSMDVFALPHCMRQSNAYTHRHPHINTYPSIHIHKVSIFNIILLKYFYKYLNMQNLKHNYIKLEA